MASIDENKNSHRKITMTHTQTVYINCIALHAGKKGARPAEVGALASVFEKPATELKQQKLLKCKQTIQIVTFKVRTLNRIGQLPELIASAVEHKINIICIQEHRYTHTETGNGWTLATVSAWKNSVNATVGGDMNAQIGKNGNNKYSLHNTTNRNEQHLTDFMIESRLTCLYTNFQKREGKL